jgi:hypothetical protein
LLQRLAEAYVTYMKPESAKVAPRKKAIKLAARHAAIRCLLPGHIKIEDANRPSPSWTRLPP